MNNKVLTGATLIASAFSRFIEILNEVNKKQEDDDGDIEIEEKKL